MSFGVLLFLILSIGSLVVVKEVKATSKTQSEAINWVKSKVNQAIDADGVYGAQCVDLIRAYYNYLGVEQVAGNGCDYATNTLPSGWQRIQGAQPQKGDILVYTGGYGHVAIYESDYITYHQNYANKQYVTMVTVAYNSSAITSQTPYWGVIRPNFSSENIGEKGEMTTPIITTNKETYSVGETANISWAATSVNTDFYQYWLVVKNMTTGETIHGGDPGVAGNPLVNSKQLVLSTAGKYKITVYAVPYNDENTRGKSSTKYVSVGAYGEMTTPTISTNKEAYSVGETASISWVATSPDTDFYQYWLVVKNMTTGETIHGGDPGVAGNPLVNSKQLVLSTAGKYKIRVYAVPYTDENTRGKSSTKYVSVGAYEEIIM